MTTINASATPVLEVLDKYDGSPISHLRQCDVQEALEVVDMAANAAVEAAAFPKYKRAEVLETASRLLLERASEFAGLISREAGKTLVQARKEVTRAANTLRLSAAEVQSPPGEVIPFAAFQGNENRRGWFTREPLGLIVAITPYNDPLNLVAHKLGPAIAGGNTVILKPSQLTPLTALKLVETLHEAGLPESFLSVVLGNRHVAQALISARNVRMVSFTGGFSTGEAIARNAGIKKLSMELGGNAPIVVFDDADIQSAVDDCVSGAFWAAGQNCIGAQRILVQRTVFAKFLSEFVSKSKKLRTGDPRDPKTDVGPMISTAAASEAVKKVEDAVAAGAKLHVGGTANGPVFEPAVLTEVPRTCSIWRDEVFAPIVLLEPFDSEAEALTAANDCEYSLHAAVFTSDLKRAFRVAEALEAGGVMINDSSDYRLDAMPFGGSKYGSMGREGVRFAFEEMTQPKVVAISL